MQTQLQKPPQRLEVESVENNELSRKIPNSTNTHGQLQKVQNKSLADFVSNNEEKSIVVSVSQSKPIKEASLSELLERVATLRLYVGLPKDGGTSQELTVATNFIFNNFDHLTIDELDLAFNLFVMNKLDEFEFYGSFSPLFIGKVLNSYLHYRKITMADVIRKQEKYNQEQKERENIPSPEQQASDKRNTILDYYNEYKQNGCINDIMSICYYFFRKDKAHRELFNFKFTQQQIDEAFVWAAEKYKKEKDAVGLFKIDPKQEKLEIDRFARIWCVQKYFDNVDINVVLNNITPDLFVASQP